MSENLSNPGINTADEQPKSKPPVSLGSNLTDDGDRCKDPPGVQTIVESIPVDHSGTTVYLKGFIVLNTTKPPVVFVHDIGENLTLYRDAARDFVERGFSVFCYDQRGHGRSGRMLGHIDNFGDFTNDLLQVAAWVRHKSNGVAPIILGHGIGAIATIYFQLKYPRLCHAAILSAPSLELKWDVAPLSRFVIRRLSNFMPQLKLPRSLTPRFTSMPQIGDGSLIPDSKVAFHGISVRAASELIRAIEWAPGRFLKFSANALILCPENDQVFSYNIIDQLLLRHKHREKITVRKLAGTGHNALIENEVIVKREVELIVNWLETLGDA